MSDMAETFYNAWIAVMDEPEFRLYCCWHVDKAWRKNLYRVKGAEKQLSVYRVLRILLEETDEAAFLLLLPKAIESWKMDPDTADFVSYFEAEYVDVYPRWAFCR